MSSVRVRVQESRTANAEQSRRINSHRPGRGWSGSPPSSGSSPSAGAIVSSYESSAAPGGTASSETRIVIVHVPDSSRVPVSVPVPGSMDIQARQETQDQARSSESASVAVQSWLYGTSNVPVSDTIGSVITGAAFVTERVRLKSSLLVPSETRIQKTYAPVASVAVPLRTPVPGAI